MNKNIIRYVFFIWVLLVAFSSQTFSGELTILYDFEGGNDDGEFPMGNLLLVGDSFYGMTNFGGNSDTYHSGGDGRNLFNWD
ncbi:hypothetical protein ACFL1T_04165 [Chlamydiota bacterium]